MANYKPVAAVASIVEDVIYDDIGDRAVSSGTSSNLFGSWGEISADVGTNKAYYGLNVLLAASVSGGAGTIFEIGEGASSSEVAILRFCLSDVSSGVWFIKLYKKLTDNARLSIRVKDGETTANSFKTNSHIGAQV